jgi:hypothetical protein
MRHSASQEAWFRSDDELFTAVLNVLCDCYVRETQHAMRYRQHAERIHHPEFRQELLNIVAEEQKHAESVGTYIERLGGRIPEVVPVHVPKEQNLWLYLRPIWRKKNAAPKSLAMIYRWCSTNLLKSHAC